MRARFASTLGMVSSVRTCLLKSCKKKGKGGFVKNDAGGSLRARVTAADSQSLLAMKPNSHHIHSIR